MSKLPWFKHYNTAHSGQLIGDLIAQKEYEAALLVYIIMELISQYETDEDRGFCSVPVDKIARIMNMKPTRIDRLLARISSVSRSDLKCETDEKQPRNRSFLMRNWLKLQETRGGKRLSKSAQNSGRSKKLEVRSKKSELDTPYIPHDKVADLVMQKYPSNPHRSDSVTTGKLVSQILKSEQDCQDLFSAVQNYSDKVKIDGIEPKYIKSLRNFLSDDFWRGFVKPDEKIQSEIESRKRFELNRLYKLHTQGQLMESEIERSEQTGWITKKDFEFFLSQRGGSQK